MRAILDTNIYISALLSPGGVSAQIVSHIVAGRFELVTHQTQIDELRAVTRRPNTRRKIHEPDSGRLIKILKRTPWIDAKLPLVQRSPDPGTIGCSLWRKSHRRMCWPRATSQICSYLASTDRRAL